MSYSHVTLFAIIVAGVLNIQTVCAEDCNLNKNQVKSSVEFCSKSMKIQQDLVAFADGRSKTAIERVQKMLTLRGDLKKLRDGDNGKGLIAIGSSNYTVRQLVAMEQDNASDKEFFKNMLKIALDEFDKITKDYMGEARGMKEPTLAVINQWATQRERPDTILKEWGAQQPGTEHASMVKLVTSFATFERFICDLHCFISDMIVSCSVAYGMLRDSIHKKA